MNYDVGNLRILEAGATSQKMMTAGGDWRSMDSAPRDGTWVELKCTYGVAPWYCIARWTDEGIAHGNDGKTHTFKSREPSWQKPEGGGPCGERTLQWRPYAGEVSSYVDPTGGMQDSAVYWRGAVASKHGLPPDYFEKEVARNTGERDPDPKPRGFLRRLFYWR